MLHKIFIIVSLLIILLFHKSVKAHPHVFITSQVSVSFNNDGIDGFKVKWTFDSMFTEIMLEEYDKNSDGIFNKNEIQNIYNTAFINLEKSSYFTHIFIENKKIDIKKTSDFTAKIINGEMIYSFVIPIEVNLSNIDKVISIYCYDDSYYMDIVLDETTPVLNQDEANYKLDYSISEDPNKAYYFEQIYPQVIRVKTRRR